MADIKVKITPLDGSKEFVVNKNKINSLSVLSESTTTPAQFNFGVLSDSGVVSFSDFDLELLNLIVDDNYDPIGAFVEVIFNGKVLNKLIISDADYKASDNSVSMNLIGRESFLEKQSITQPTTYKNLYEGFVGVLTKIGIPLEKIEEELSKSITFGYGDETEIIKTALSSMKTPNYYVESSSAMDVLNTILQVASLYVKTDLEDYVFIDSSRPKFPYYNKEEIVNIQDSNLISDLSFSLIKKDKTKGVSVSESEFTYDTKTEGMYGSYYPISSEVITKSFVNENLSNIQQGKYFFDNFKNYEFRVSSNGLYLFGKFYASLQPSGECVELTQGTPYYKSTFKESKETVTSFIGECMSFGSFNDFISYVEENHGVETSNDVVDFAGVSRGNAFSVGVDSEYYFAININILNSTNYPKDEFKFDFGAPIKFKYINRNISKVVEGEEKNALEISENSLIDISATVENDKLASFLSKTIFSDYKDGIMVGAVDVSCEDYYTLEGVKIKDSSNGDIISVGDIITIKKINSMLKRDVFWKVNSSEFKYDGKPYCSISFYEIKQGAKYSRPAGLYDNYGNIVYTWDELISNGYITIENSTMRISGVNDSVLSGYLQIKNGIKSANIGTFSNCVGLKGIYMPQSVSVGSAGGTNNNLEIIHLSDRSNYITNHDSNIVMSSNGYVVFGLKTATEIPEGPHTISDWAFFGIDIEKISIPSSVTTIGGRAFWNCSKLKSVVFSEGLEFIEDNAFLGCSSVESYSIPYSVKTLNESIFGNNTSLKRAFIPSTVEKITSTDAFGSLFYGCPSDCIIYTDVENESSIPSGWRFYFKYYDNVHTLQIKYGWTKEQFDALQ